MYKLALIGDSGEARDAADACCRGGTYLAAWHTPLCSRPAGVGKTCILLRFAEGGFNVSFMSTVGCVPSTGYFIILSTANSPGRRVRYEC
eukprot:COSAG02_NODE_5536_length_4247_cov_1.589923_6_plen_90_part_00